MMLLFRKLTCKSRWQDSLTVTLSKRRKAGAWNACFDFAACVIRLRQQPPLGKKDWDIRSKEEAGLRKRKTETIAWAALHLMKPIDYIAKLVFTTDPYSPNGVYSHKGKETLCASMIRELLHLNDNDTSPAHISLTLTSRKPKDESKEIWFEVERK